MPWTLHKTKHHHANKNTYCAQACVHHFHNKSLSTNHLLEKSPTLQTVANKSGTVVEPLRTPFYASSWFFKNLYFGCRFTSTQFEHYLLNKDESVFHALGVVQVQGIDQSKKDTEGLRTITTDPSKMIPTLDGLSWVFSWPRQRIPTGVSMYESLSVTS